MSEEVSQTALCKRCDALFSVEVCNNGDTTKYCADCRERRRTKKREQEHGPGRAQRLKARRAQDLRRRARRRQERAKVREAASRKAALAAEQAREALDEARKAERAAAQETWAAWWAGRELKAQEQRVKREKHAQARKARQEQKARRQDEAQENAAHPGERKCYACLLWLPEHDFPKGAGRQCEPCKASKERSKACKTSGFCYLLRLRGTNHFKVGKAEVVDRRMKAIRVNNPLEPVIVRTWPGGLVLEAELKRVLDVRARALQGEWYAVDNPERFEETLKEDRTGRTTIPVPDRNVLSSVARCVARAAALAMR